MRTKDTDSSISHSSLGYTRNQSGLFYRKRPNEERGESDGAVILTVDNLSREDEDNQAYCPSVPKQAKNSEPSPMEVDE